MDDEPIKLQELEADFRRLLKGQHSSLAISFNDGNGPNYMSVREWVDAGEDEGFISPQEQEAACRRNSCWTLQWYPDTPVGFCRVSASSLPALIDYIRNLD